MENPNFKKLILPFESKMVKVKVPDFQVDRIHQFVAALVAKKQTERHHFLDKFNEAKRFYTGILGEAALEEFLKVDIIDWRVGPSTLFNQADLTYLNLEVGIKTVEYGKFPVIHKNVKRPEIINFKISNHEVLIGGLATVEVLKTYQDDDLILSKALKKKGTKTGFYGFHALQLFQNIKELYQLLNS